MNEWIDEQIDGQMILLANLFPHADVRRWTLTSASGSA